jgi:hypothetical protein
LDLRGIRRTLATRTAAAREPAVGLVAAETAAGGVWVSNAEGVARLRLTGKGDTITARP